MKQRGYIKDSQNLIQKPMKFKFNKYVFFAQLISVVYKQTYQSIKQSILS